MPPRVTAVRPAWAIEGGRILIEGGDFPIDRPRLPDVQIGGASARAVAASSTSLGVIVPGGLEAGPAPIRIEGVAGETDRKSTRLNSSHLVISYAVFCLKKKKTLSTIDVHAAAIFGEHDVLTPPDESRLIAEAISGARLVSINQAGQTPHLQNPAAFD